MPTLTETNHTGEFLLAEANGEISREQVTVTVSGSTPWLSGTLLGRITATGKFIKYLNGAVDGSQTVAGILWNELAPVAGDIKATVIVRDAEVIGSKLTGSDAPGLVDLAAMRVVVR
jgi:hypothetical protein